jgi:hypothetical protein
MGSLIGNTVTLNLATLIVLQKNLQGTIFGGSNPYCDIPHLLSMYKVGKLNLDGMVTNQCRLEEINDGYRDMLERCNIRGIIRYTGADRRDPPGHLLPGDRMSHPFSQPRVNEGDIRSNDVVSQAGLATWVHAGAGHRAVHSV